MKKILALSLGLFLLAGVTLAQTDTTASTGAGTGTPATLTVTPVIPTCMQSAVAKREVAINHAFNTFASTVSAAYSTRAAAMDVAWGAKKDATVKSGAGAGKVAMNDFNFSISNAKKTFKKEKATAWTTFATTAKKECKTKVSESVNSEISL